jgi:[acyl-carrier-protein] S-malonyltransferase
MGQALAEMSPICRETFAEADAALGEPFSRLIFAGPEDQLTLTANTQPAILTVSVAAMRFLVSRGLSPSFVAGHSFGEFSANVTAGTLSFADAVRTVRNRGRYMQEAVPVGTGAMAAILGLEAAAVAEACAESAHGDVVSIAGLNGGGQIVIAGGRDAVARASAAAKARGAKRALPLSVSAPFHCALMKPAEERLAPELRALPVAAPRMPVIAGADGQPKRTSSECIEALVAQICAPVRWEDVVLRLASEGVTTYVEVGAGNVLSGLVRKIDRNAQVVPFGAPEDWPAIESLLSGAGAH